MRFRCKSFRHDERGSVVVMFSLALLPLLGMTGVGLDYAMTFGAHSKLQEATDAAALAAVITRVPTATLRQQAAQAAFAANAPTGVNAVANTTNVTSRQTTVTATGSVRTVILHLLGTESTSIGASARAAKVFEGPPPCILALNSSASDAVKIAGNASYVANNCTIHSNSNSLSGISITNNATVTGASFCAVGETNVPSALEPLARDYCEPVEDPLRGLAKPLAGSCIATKLVLLRENGEHSMTQEDLHAPYTLYERVSG